MYMPFGIKIASAVFTRLMRHLLQGLPNVVHYIDDFLIATTTWQKITEILQHLLRRIREAGLMIKPQKCDVDMTSIVFHGHRLGGEIIQPVEETISKIAKAP